MAKDLHGSNGHRLHLRNEIRSMLKTHGCPAFFVTLNPADIHNKLLHILAGGTASSFEGMDAFARAKEVSENPRAGAQFFDLMIQAFIKIILRHDDPRGGVFGRSKAYYGTVEAQGRGTLHCHMLIWIRGNLSPQKLRDRMAADSIFKESMFSWVESIIKCELPDMNEALPSDHRGRCKKPNRQDRSDVRTTDAPFLRDDASEDELQLFETNFQEFVKAMAIECNWHEHRDTCWKHLKKGEPRDDAHCRMRVDGKTRAITELDEAMWSILLRRLHPWINNFNDLILFLMKCNMDIKFIGSGEAAKALVYYVTDYITKASLPAHLGLSALCYAIRANKKKYANDHDSAQSVVYRSLVIKIVNAMMARLELSQQQVMSYLLGNGDWYTSDVFRTLYYGELDRFIEVCENSHERPEDLDNPDDFSLIEHNENIDDGPNAEEIVADVDAIDEVEDGLHEQASQHAGIGGEGDHELATEEGSMNLRISPEGITASSLLKDYRFRSTSLSFENLSVWEHASLVEKVTASSEQQRVEYDQNRSVQGPSWRAARVKFSDEAHPQYKTHLSYLRRMPSTPLYLGSAIPRGDRRYDERERYCRAMLILFKPWRCLRDLKEKDEEWSAAFQRTIFSPGMIQIMDNIAAENECKDVREEYDYARRRGQADGMLQDGESAVTRGFYDQLEESTIADQDLDFFPSVSGLELNTDVPCQPDPAAVANNMIDARVTHSVDVLDRAGMFKVPANHSEIASSSSSRTYSVTPGELQKQERLMKKYKANRRPRVKCVREDHSNDNWRSNYQQPSVSVGMLSAEEQPVVNYSTDIEYDRDENSTVRDVINDMNISGNLEQEHAVRIVANHINDHAADQLLMYLAGVGGTGKSHVIKSIVELFRCLERSEKLMLSAPTGIAAVLIEGYTIHALTFLPKSKHKSKTEELMNVWKDVQYLIIDEISMVSALFLSQISNRIAEAKGWQPGMCDLPFGGVNVIFTGDFGQLCPVQAKTLFAHELVSNISSNQAQSPMGQGALFGAHLWRQVNTVVELTTNMRQKDDKAYAELVGRVRVGQATNTGQSNENSLSDYETLTGRLMNVLQDKELLELKKFERAPIIVADKCIRDAVNMNKAKCNAIEHGRTCEIYHSIDRTKRKPVTGALATKLRKVRSSVTKDALGELLLFVGMPVMITENVDISHGIVNGSEGTVEHIIPHCLSDGTISVKCVYVRIPGSNIHLPGLDVDVAPIFPADKTFKYKVNRSTHFNISRHQVPLLPAYSYMDYKSQGRSLEHAILDLAGCRSVQSLYVMLSRVKTLKGVVILRWFPPGKIAQALSHEYRDEFARLHALAFETKLRYPTSP